MVLRDGQPIVENPVSIILTTAFASILWKPWIFLAKGGHDINLDHYPDHIVLVFNLHSTQKDSHDSIHPELTNCSNPVHLLFDRALAANVEKFFLVKNSPFFVNLEQNVIKKSIITYPTDG